MTYTDALIITIGGGLVAVLLTITLIVFAIRTRRSASEDARPGFVPTHYEDEPRYITAERDPHAPYRYDSTDYEL